MNWGVVVGAIGLLAASQACAQPAALKAAVENKWGCIGTHTTDNHPDRARYGNRKGCIREFHLACEDKSGADEIPCLKRETAIWQALIQTKLIAGARENDAGKPGAAAAMERAARAAKASRLATCGFIRKYGVNAYPATFAVCELNDTGEFAMKIYNWLYTP